MNIQQLEYFLFVKDTGSLNIASQHFFISRQAINSSLKKLESEIGAPLFHYNNKGVTLTPQGMVFAPYAEKIINNYADALQEVTLYQEQDLQLQGTLTIYAASIFTELFLPRIIGKFQVYHPQVDIHIVEIDNSDLLTNLVRDNVKIGLFSYTKDIIEDLLHKGNIPDLACLNLMDDSLVLCGRSDNPLLRHKTLSLDDLTRFMMKYCSGFSLYQLNSYNGSDLIEEKLITRSSSAALHKNLMMEDIGLTFMPKLAYRAQFEEEGIQAIDIIGGQKIMHGILYKEDASNALQQVFLKYLERELRDILSQSNLI